MFRRVIMVALSFTLLAWVTACRRVPADPDGATTSGATTTGEPDKTKFTAGGLVILANGSPTLPLATEVAALHAIRAGGSQDKAGFDQLAQSGKILTTNSGTYAIVIEDGPDWVKVRIESGQYGGREVYIVRDWVLLRHPVLRQNHHPGPAG